MTQNEIKEAYRLFWMVKGHINTTENTILSSADGYFKRLWLSGADGAPLEEYEKGFEEAWENFQNGKQENRGT
jgi:hypothetical protein